MSAYMSTRGVELEHRRTPPDRMQLGTRRLGRLRPRERGCG